MGYPVSAMKRRYDFDSLCSYEPSLRKFIKHEASFEFDNPNAVRSLNRALLKSTYGLDVVLPEGHLCPTIENRSRYIILIETILFRVLNISKDSELHGIDIGTGASCIYPLIAVKRNPTWTFTGVDVDLTILDYARSNVTHNELDSQIGLLYNPDPLLVFPSCLSDELASNKMHKFVICNPPFFSSIEDMNARRAAKQALPLASGNEIAFSEAVHTDGGELGFIKKLIAGSQDMAKQHKIRLFSCLLGLKESFIAALQILKNKSGCFYAYERIRVSHTCRWVLFWSFTDPFPVDLQGRLVISAMVSGIQSIKQTLTYEDAVAMLSLYGKVEKEDVHYTLKLSQNTWSRKARRSGCAEPLPDVLAIEFSIVDEELVFYFDTQSKELWDIFVGFVNHLRKTK